MGVTVAAVVVATPGGLATAALRLCRPPLGRSPPISLGGDDVCCKHVLVSRVGGVECEVVRVEQAREAVVARVDGRRGLGSFS